VIDRSVRARFPLNEKRIQCRIEKKTRTPYINVGVCSSEQLLYGWVGVGDRWIDITSIILLAMLLGDILLLLLYVVIYISIMVKQGFG